MKRWTQHVSQEGLPLTMVEQRGNAFIAPDLDHAFDASVLRTVQGIRRGSETLANLFVRLACVGTMLFSSVESY